MSGEKDVIKSSMPIVCLLLAISACTESAPDQAASPSPEMPMIDACRLITPVELTVERLITVAQSVLGRF